MQYSISPIFILLCLARFLGLNVVGAWSAVFYSEELACGDDAANANSTSLEYVGPDLDDTLIPQLMACLDLGMTIEDPLVNCTAHLNPSEAGPTGTGDCDGLAGFVGKSVTVTNMIFCLGYSSGNSLAVQAMSTTRGRRIVRSKKTAATQVSGSVVSSAFSSLGREPSAVNVGAAARPLWRGGNGP
ncbi:hypothetical protein F4782DRAFT_527340 [Xylaria castorea]|nr:hypothetical protein F4782DRAFT_527340 [Xylaria castorea]